MDKSDTRAAEEKVAAEFKEIADAKYAKLVVIVRNGRLHKVFTEQEKNCDQKFTEPGGRN